MNSIEQKFCKRRMLLKSIVKSIYNYYKFIMIIIIYINYSFNEYEKFLGSEQQLKELEELEIDELNVKRVQLGIWQYGKDKKDELNDLINWSSELKHLYLAVKYYS